MKGKLLIQKLIRPSIVFASGVFIILFMISFFVYLHVTAVNNLEKIVVQINEIQQMAASQMSGSASEENETRLVIVLDQLNEQETLQILLGWEEYIFDRSLFKTGTNEELFNTYSQVDRMKQIVHRHSLNREKSSRILYLIMVVTINCMILFLGVSQYENYKMMKSDKFRDETNNKLYDQLEKERSLIAFELHDDIAQKLAIIKRYFNSRNSIDEHTVLMENYSSEVIKRVRYLSRMLKAPDNPDVSFKDYLETLFSDFNVLSDFKLNRKTVGLNALKLKPSAALHVYRIIQEILTNSRIHSEATEIDLLIVYSHPSLNIKYRDNGTGFDPYLVYRKGIGLDSIKYRLEILKGSYHMKTAEGEGTDISIDIPVELCEIS